MLNATRDFRRQVVSMAALAGMAMMALAGVAAPAPAPPLRTFHAAAGLELTQSEEALRFCADVGEMVDGGAAADADFSPKAMLWDCPKAVPPAPRLAAPAAQAPQLAGLLKKAA